MVTSEGAGGRRQLIVAFPADAAGLCLRGKPEAQGARHRHVAPNIGEPAPALVAAGGRTVASADDLAVAGWTADEAVTGLFAAQYRPLVRLASLLLRDPGLAEEVVQDAFVGLHQRWGRLRDPDAGAAYLRQSVVNRCRSALRHRGVVDRFLRRQSAPALAPSAETWAMNAETHAEVLAAVRALPARQREALVLRYYLDLSEAQAAEVMGVSTGAVKSHTARALAALRRTMENPR